MDSVNECKNKEMKSTPYYRSSRVVEPMDSQFKVQESKMHKYALDNFQDHKGGKNEVSQRSNKQIDSAIKTSIKANTSKR
jgi:hypothetical protein